MASRGNIKVALHETHRAKPGVSDNLSCQGRLSPIPVESMVSFMKGIAEASMKAGTVYKYDLSFLVKMLYKIVEEMWQRLATINFFSSISVFLYKSG
ncbi:hypothetical protein ZOSMA_7G00840 [Zostera marina]|uniref:Uncharacterized protein n=1 Tax=Zostera marina TaxID=29655 RepID=A0A0K9NPZ8_ZOSMR|nr:hypothetical protein ZOSMA_7G00840 [Zostera marina]